MDGKCSGMVMMHIQESVAVILAGHVEIDVTVEMSCCALTELKNNTFIHQLVDHKGLT